MDYDELDLSANQKVILKKFRSSLQDILTPEYTDAKILKWLRASNFDLKKAEQIFREVNSCRKIFGTNTITDTYIVPEVLQKYVRTGFLGFAKDGSAIRYYGLHVDVLGLAYSISLYDTFSFFSYVVESDLKKLKEQNEKTGQNHSKITFILDFDEFSYKDIFHKFVIDAGLDMFSNFQGHYPESWSVFLMINAPYIVDKILMLFKPAFKSRFLDSFQVATRSSTSTLLKNYIDEDLLPVFLGGSRVDSTGDPLCRELINGYHKVPEKFYLKNIMHFIDETDPDVKVVILRPWSVYNFPVTVKEAGTKIRVEIRTENGSLHFTILHRNFSSNSDSFEFTESKEKLNFDDESLNLRVVGPRVKGHTQISPYDFMLHAHWSGFYIFYFENTSSWFTSQKLYYRITIFPPDL